MRLPRLAAADVDAHRRVEQQRRRRRLLRGDRREVGEGLERRARLAPHGRGAVEWREAVVAAADERAHAAAARVDGEDGHLQRLAPGLRADPAEARLELPRPVRRGALRGRLRARIDLASDREAAFDHALDADGVDELGAERAEVERERRLRDLSAAELDHARDGVVVLRVVDPVPVAHDREDGVAPHADDVRPLVGRVAVRRADHAGEQRGLVEAELLRTLVEVEARRFVDAEHRLAAAVPEVDVVEVDLEDLVLLHPRVEEDRQRDLHELAAPRPLLREEARLHDLLVDRAAALGDAARAEVEPERAGHADRVDADVVAEAHVLRGDERVRHEARQRRERHRRRDAPVDAVERPDALRRAARTGQKNGRRAPGVAHQLARETPIEDEKIDGRSEQRDPDQRRARDHPSRQAK